jgi:hypothetical protein
MTFLQAVDRIVKHEKLNTSAEHYLNQYDIALAIIFGNDLYTGAGACAKRAKELRGRKRK